METYLKSRKRRSYYAIFSEFELPEGEEDFNDFDLLNEEEAELIESEAIACFDNYKPLIDGIFFYIETTNTKYSSYTIGKNGANFSGKLTLFATGIDELRIDLK